MNNEVASLMKPSRKRAVMNNTNMRRLISPFPLLFIVHFSVFIVHCGASRIFGGDEGIRTHDPLLAKQVLSQLSYTPMCTIRETDWYEE